MAVWGFPMLMVQPQKDKVVIAAKFGVTHGGDSLIMDSNPKTIRKSVEGSLKRLGVDVIDLYYQHRIDEKVSPEEVTEIDSLLDSIGMSEVFGGHPAEK